MKKRSSPCFQFGLGRSIRPKLIHKETPVTLQDLRGGGTALVIAVDAPEKDRQRLESIGVIPGLEIEVLANNGGPILAAVGDARIAVERSLAALVIVV